MFKPLLHPSLSLACLPVLKIIPAEQMNNIHDSTASLQCVTVFLLCPPELLVALVKISSLLLQLFGSSSPRVPIILEGISISHPPTTFSPPLPPLNVLSYLAFKLLHNSCLDYTSNMSKQQGFDCLNRSELHRTILKLVSACSVSAVLQPCGGKDLSTGLRAMSLFYRFSGKQRQFVTINFQAACC